MDFTRLVLMVWGVAAQDGLAAPPCVGCYEDPVSGHVYNPEHDGGGKCFEDLPASWVDPVDGTPKSDFVKCGTRDGWLARAPLSAKVHAGECPCMKSIMTGHVYDPAKHGNGKCYKDLPATWLDPMSGAPAGPGSGMYLKCDRKAPQGAAEAEAVESDRMVKAGNSIDFSPQYPSRISLLSVPLAAIPENPHFSRATEAASIVV